MAHSETSTSTPQKRARTDEETPLLRTHERDQHDHERYDSFSSSSSSTLAIGTVTGCELESAPDSKRETPLDWPQFSLVLFLQLAEPLTSQVIYPFMPQLIRELGVTNGDETKVGYYVGMMQSIFFFAEGLTVLHWSRLSDTLGRKPVILTGLLGLGLSMYCFGLSRTFAGLVVSRSLSGALNGNIGVIKSIMGEMTDETNIARAIAWFPLSWSTGATIGPLIGGALSHPAERFPSVFGNNEFLRTNPYFLPCAIPASFTLICWVITYIYLKETNPQNITLSSLLSRNLKSKVSTPGAPTKDSDSSLLLASPAPPRAPPLRSILTPRTLLAASSYALISLLDVAFRALQPVFYATPPAFGGLGLAPHHIGAWLALVGTGNGVFQAALFPRMCRRLGVRGVFLLGIASAAPIFALFPAMSVVVVLREAYAGDGGVVDLPSSPSPSPHTALDIPSTPLQTFLTLLVPLLLLTQLTLTLLLNSAFSSSFIYITASAPPRSLGAVNGLAQTSVSFARGVGPALASSLFSASLRWRYAEGRGLVWGWCVYGVMLLMVVGTLVVGFRLPERPWAREAEAEALEGI